MTSPSRPLRSLRALADFGLTLLLAAAAVGLIGLFRLWRQFPAAAASPALLVPFLLPVLALALEAGALVAVSSAQLHTLGRSVARSLVPSGEVRSSEELRWTAVAARGRATLPILAMLLVVVAVAEVLPRGTEHPGAFANELVQRARSSCGQDGHVPVPLLGLSVDCRERRIEGPMPGVGSIQVAMRELTFSDDLRRVEVVGLDLTAKRALSVHLVADRARIAGLAPWSRSPRLSPAGRFAILTGLGFALWLAGCLGWRAVSVSVSSSVSVSRPSGRTWKRALSSLLLAIPGAVVAACFIWLDQDQAAPAAYASAAVLGFLALGLLRLLGQRVPRIFSSFSSF